MWTEALDPNQPTLWVDVQLTGPLGSSSFTFLIDTGSPVTIIDPDVIHDLGYEARMGGRIHRLWAIKGGTPSFDIAIAELTTMGFSLNDQVVFCEEMPRHLAVDGIIGMDLLRGHVLTIDLVAGSLTVDA